jgi:hypothetical protein
MFLRYLRSQDSSVDVVTMRRTGCARNRDYIPGRDNRFISITNGPDRLWAPLSLLVSGYRMAHSPRVKRPRHEVDPFTTHVVRRLRMGGASTSIPLYAFVVHGTLQLAAEILN